jgi:hypothetical protein
MKKQHFITPPSELLQLWGDQHYQCNKGFNELLIEAAQWGADQELEACCEWLQDPDLNVDTYKLRAARRPKPLSLKEQALKALDHILNNSSTDLGGNAIRRALEQLPDNE